MNSRFGLSRSVKEHEPFSPRVLGFMEQRRRVDRIFSPTAGGWLCIGAVCALIVVCIGPADFALAVEPAVFEAQQHRSDVIARVVGSVIAIFGPDGGGGGSGVVISPDGYALSNFHVTSSSGDFMKCGLSDGQVYDAVIVGVDPTGDVALIKLLGKDAFPSAVLGDSDKLKVGDWVYAMGNPFLLATDFQPTVTYGIVSGVHRYQYPAGTFLEYTDCIQVDSSINPGNSGGPLFNTEGELVGINGRGSFEKRGRVNSGAGYAISINQIRNFMGHLRSGRIVDHATLGTTVTGEDDGSVVVADILESSEAHRRGLRIGDEIVSFADRPIRSVNQFKNILGIYPKGWRLPLIFRHETQRQEALVRLRGLHRESELLPGGGHREMPPDDGDPPRRHPDEPDPDQPGPNKLPDGKTPDGKTPDDKPPKDPRPRRPGPMGRTEAAEPPEAFKHMLVKKEGYANYYFNKLNQERLLKNLSEYGAFSTAPRVWSLAGRTSAGTPFEFTLAPQGASLELGKEIFLQQVDGPIIAWQDEPPESGGLLAALYHWQLLLREGPNAFGETYYLGTEPVDGVAAGLADVLITRQALIECRWYFHVLTGEFVGFDVALGEDADECEVRFLQFNEADGRQLPSRILVRCADKEFAVFHVERVTMKDAAAPKSSPKVSQ